MTTTTTRPACGACGAPARRILVEGRGRHVGVACQFHAEAWAAAQRGPYAPTRRLGARIGGGR